MRLTRLAVASLPFLVGGCFTVQTSTGGSDAGTGAAEADVDVVGAWHGCGLDLQFAADGTAQLTSAPAGCSSPGTYSVAGRVLSATWDIPTCAQSATWEREVVLVGSGMVLVELATGHTQQYVTDATPRSLWRLDATDGSGASTTMRILGSTETGVIQGCYWSTDLACGGIFSCGGMVSRWTTDATTFGATTGCDGDCPCGAVLTGSAEASGYAGTYSGTNCTRMFSGSFTVTRLETR